MNKTELVKIWYYIKLSGDGCVHLVWLLKENHAEKMHDNDDEGWGDPCHGSITTIKSSKEYLKAVLNSFSLENPKTKNMYLTVNPISFEVSVFSSLDEVRKFAKPFKNWVWPDLSIFPK